MLLSDHTMCLEHNYVILYPSSVCRGTLPGMVNTEGFNVWRVQVKAPREEIAYACCTVADANCKMWEIGKRLKSQIT